MENKQYHWTECPREDETKKEDTAEDREIEIDREDGGGRGFRQVNQAGE